MHDQFKKELTDLINMHGLDRHCNTPDYILADYMTEYALSHQKAVEPATQPDSIAKGWGLRRHVKGEIVVSYEDGSGVVIREDADRIAESLFYRMMDQILTPNPEPTVSGDEG